MGRRLSLTEWVRAIILSVCILTGAVVITLNFSPLYRLDMKLFSISENSGYTEEQVWENYRALIDYNNIGGAKGRISFPSMPVSVPAAIHFEEVRRIFVAIEICFFISLPLYLILCAVLHFSRSGAGAGTNREITHRQQPRGYLLLTAFLTGLLPLLLGLLVAANWEAFFIGFHRLVFNNDYWLFDPAEDPIIMILPDGYFLHCAVMILGIWLVSSSVCLLLWRKRSHPGRKAGN